MSDSEEDRPNCDDCGHVFVTLHWHVKLWCPERTSLKRKREEDDNSDDGEDNKWIDYEGDEDEEIVDDDAARHAYKKLYDLAKAGHDDEPQQNIDKYVNEQGMTEEDAAVNVETKLQDTYLKTFMTKYSCVFQYWMDLRHDSRHNQIIDSIKEYVTSGYDVEKSIRRTLKKHKHDLEAFIEDVDEEEEEEDYTAEDND
jgi:hypothetical protein